MTRLWQWFRRNSYAAALSLVLHGLIIAALIVSFATGSHPNSMPGSGSHPQPQPMNAVVVSQKDLQAAQATLGEAQRAKQARLRRLQEQAQRAEKERAQAQQQLQSLKQKTNQQLEAQKQASSKMSASLKQQQAQLAQLTAQANKIKQQRQAQAKALKEEQAKAEAAKKARQAEEKKLAKLKAQAAARRKRAKEKREARLKAKARAAEKARLHKEMGYYISAIRSKVEENWNRPPSTPDNLNCAIKIVQQPGGTVVKATLGSCNADTAVQQSIITAVYKASPLPQPGDPKLFSKQITFIFSPSS